jgi:hypothetical protein
MKVLINISTVFLLLLCLVSGCTKEEKLTPTEGRENVYGNHTLPQGNHPYDAEILNLFNKYGTMFLYKYVPKDLYYNINTYTGGIYDTASNKTTRAGLFDVPANEGYIGMQLDLLKDIWMKYYPDELLKQGMTQKVYLVDSFYYAYNGPGKPSDNWPWLYNVSEGPDYILAAWGSARLNAMTNEEKYTMKSELNSMFLSIAHRKGVVKRSTAFSALTNYSAANAGNYRDYGLIDYWGSNTADKDWDTFVQTIVSHSYTELTSSGGVLHPTYDTKGLIKRKYDILIAYFQSALGVDLQLIGNAGK